MVKFILKRILSMIPILFLIIFIIFFILNVTPGNPGRIILGAIATEEEVDAVNESLGLNKPLIERYILYTINVFKGDFGDSYIYQHSVIDEIGKKFPLTLRLAFFSIIISALIGIPFGIISAVKQYSALDISLTVGSLFFASIPGFWLGIMMIILFSLKLGWLPSSGIGSFKQYIMPVLTLALPSAAHISRMMRATMLEVLRQDYIRTAKAKGAKKINIILNHALRNSLMPAVTIIGTTFAYMLGGAIIAEVVFSLPGIGTVILSAIRLKDVPSVAAAVIIISLAFMLIILIIDISYMFLDPRIKKQFL